MGHAISALTFTGADSAHHRSAPNIQRESHAIHFPAWTRTMGFWSEQRGPGTNFYQLADYLCAVSSVSIFIVFRKPNAFTGLYTRTSNNFIFNPRVFVCNMRIFSFCTTLFTAPSANI